MFDDFDKNVSAEEFYFGLYASWEVDGYERKKENKSSIENVYGRIGTMASF